MDNASLLQENQQLKARIEELEAKLNPSNIAEFCGIAMIESMTAKELHQVFGELIEKAQESNQGLADKARLDWLDQVNASSNEKNGTVYGWRFDINHNRAALTDCNYPALDIRHAIDAAIESQRATNRTATEVSQERLRIIADLRKFVLSFASERESQLNSIEGCEQVTNELHSSLIFKSILNAAIKCGAIEPGRKYDLLSLGKLEIAVLIQ